MIKLQEYDINPALIVIDMQNGFISKGGSYDLLGVNVLPYQKVVPEIQHLISMCRSGPRNSIGKHIGV
jgi:ureidoacrylate peracid hydrolase